MFTKEVPRRSSILSARLDERATGGLFYYSGNRKIPVIALESAVVVRQSAEERRTTPEPGWIEIPLGHPRYALRVRSEAVSERELGTYQIEALVYDLLRLDATFPAPDERARAGRIRRDEVAAVVDEGGALLMPTGEVVAQFPASRSLDQIEAILRAEGAVGWRSIHGLDRTFAIDPAHRAAAFTFAARLVEKYGATYAAPNFIEEMPPRIPPIPPNDLYDQEWHIGRAAIASAWDITRGSADIVLCIIDSGIDTKHEAFADAWKFVPGFDFQDDDPFPDATTSSHGTSCAGVAVASWGRGKVVGAAPGCRLMPVRRGSCSDHLSMAEAFLWVANQGADVISCSFGFDNRPWVLPDVARAALEHAAVNGRRGRGCVIVWAAGNGNEPVSTDEWASSPHVIAVAASTDADNRAYYSDYGPEVALCAPSNGGSRGIITTVNGGYTTQFGGTSAAAPLVAGVAALVLSIAPGLSARDVRDLLCRNADPIDPQNGAYDSTGHSAWYGFGRVNAVRALAAISVLDELVRSDAELRSRLSDIRRFANEVLAPRAAGRALLEVVQAKRFRMLELGRRNPTFQRDLRRVLRAIAEASVALMNNRPLVLDDATWTSLVAVARGLLEPAEDRGLEGGERAMNEIFSSGPARPGDDTKNVRRTKMNDTNATIDEVLAKLGELLRAPQGTNGGPTPPGGPTNGGPTNGGPGVSITPSGGPVVSGTQPPFDLGSPEAMMRLREWLATEMMYMQRIPPITAETLEGLDDLVEQAPARLKAIGARPYLMSQVVERMRTAGSAFALSERETMDPEFVNIMNGLTSQATEERIVPLLCLFAAGITVGRAIASF